MWMALMAMLLLVLGAGCIYLASRMNRFASIRRLTKGSARLGFLAGLAIVAVLFAVCAWAMGVMNAVVCMIHLALAFLLSEGFFRLIRRRNPKRYYAGGLALVLAVAYLTAGWYAANHVWQTHYAIATDKAVGRLRIVQLADAHVGTTFDGAGFAKCVERIQETDPDVVVITGDYVDDDTSREDMIAACAALGALKTPCGVYYVFGNHDKGYYDSAIRGYDGDDLIAELEKNGVTVLQDESVLLEDRYYIIGRRDRSEARRAEMAALVEPLDADKYMVVLDHQPCDYEAQAEAGVDLVLSGHTHGGQMIPLNWFNTAFSENDRTYGHEKRGNTDFIVTSGISDWALRFKTGCRSEFVVIDIEGK